MRILYGLITVLALTTGLPAQVCLTTTDVVSDCTSPCSKPAFWGSAGLVSWTPHLRGLDFAATEDGSALAIGAGQSHDIDYDRDTGFRTQLGFNTAVGWGVSFGYTHFGTEGFNAVTRPPGTGQLFATFSHPGGPEEADVASASASFDYDVFDLVARYPVIDQRFIGLDLYGGFRWADISQEINASFDGRDFVNGVVNNRADVNAFGFRFGGESHWRMASGWSAFGSASVAALYGKIDNHRFESNINGAQTLVDFRDSYNQPIFNLDTALGVAWSRKNWSLSGGYEFNVWTNLGDNLRFVDDIEEGSFTALPGDLLLEGFFVRCAKAW